MILDTLKLPEPPWLDTLKAKERWAARIRFLFAIDDVRSIRVPRKGIILDTISAPAKNMIYQSSWGFKYGIPYLKGSASFVPQPPHATIDPDFWERLRVALRSHMDENDLTQREMAAMLGLDSTSLNNFLNHHSDRLGGLAVALACTIVNLVCDGTPIGRIAHPQNGHPQSRARPPSDQLVLEFDAEFQIKQDAEIPTLISRKAPAADHGIRLFIKRIG